MDEQEERRRENDWIVDDVLRTLFADERVVPVVGIVRVTKSTMGIFEFEKLVAVLARMTRAFLDIYNDGARRMTAKGQLSQDSQEFGREYYAY